MENKEKLQKLAAKMAPKYGTIVEGKHEGMQVGLGTDPSKTVSVSYDAPSQMVIFENDEEKARYIIEDEINTISIGNQTEKGYLVTCEFKDGDKFVLELEWKPEDNFIVSIFKNLMRGGKGLPTKQDKIAMKYSPIKVFFRSFIAKLNYKDAKFLYDLYLSNNIYDDVRDVGVKALVELYEKKANASK